MLLIIYKISSVWAPIARLLCSCALHLHYKMGEFKNGRRAKSKTA